MSHDHASAGARHAKRLVFALFLTGGFMVVEAVVGYLAGSLVLIADAGHMLTDTAGISFALIAIWFARRPATVRKTYGYYRIEILAAMLNGLLLFGVAAYILIEAARRFQSPPDVQSTPILIVATLGLVVNLSSMWILMAGSRESLNVRGAFLEVMGDVLGSVGAIAAGVILLTTGWRYADPLIAAAVGLFILPRTFLLMKEALDVLLEGTPRSIDLPAVVDSMLAVPGVEAVHDLHVWSVTSGFLALSGHVEAARGSDRDGLLVELHTSLRDQFEVEHVTIQVESPDLEQRLGQPCLPDSTTCYAGPARRAVPLPTIPGDRGITP